MEVRISIKEQTKSVEKKLRQLNEDYKDKYKELEQV